MEEFESSKNDYIKFFSRKRKHALRRLQACQEDLNRFLTWEQLFHQGELLQANLFRIKKGMNEVSLDDWLNEGKKVNIKLDPLIQPYEQAKHFFRQSKKWKLAIPHIEKQIVKRIEESKVIQRTLDELTGITDEAGLKAWIKLNAEVQNPSKGKTTVKESLPYHEFFSSTGMPIRVGKGARSNDQLTFKISKGSDWWFHVRDYPGSHVVLSVQKGQEPDQASVIQAMQLALAYSKIKDEKESEITVTQCKYVNRFKEGPPGKVQISKHKVMLIKQDKELLKQIKSFKPAIYHPHQQSDSQHP